jgi:hypothetical protein
MTSDGTVHPLPDPARATAVPADGVGSDRAAGLPPPLDEDVVEPGPPPGSLAFSLQRARRIFDRVFRVPASLKRWLAPELAGFHRHGWSGKLYLMTTAAVLVLSTPLAILFTLLVASSADSATEVALALSLSAFLSWLAVVYYRVLRGVARFERKARKIAMIFLVLGMMGGLNVILSDMSSGQTLAAFAEIAVSAQFLFYFMRNRDHFLTDGDVELLEREPGPAESS